MPTFGRVLTAMATPFTDDNTLDAEGAQRLAAHLLAHGSDGLVVAGTTGESPTLSQEETRTLFAAVVEAADGAPVVAGCGTNDTAATVRRVGEATAAGVDGVLLVTPYYNKPSQRGLVGHFTTACAATELPVYLYDIPGRTGREIAPETLLRLAETVDNVRGVKDAAKDLDKCAWLASRAPEDFDVVSGDDSMTLPMLAVGAVGVISVSSHLVGEAMREMVTVFERDPAAARSIHHRLLPLFTTLMTADPSPGPLKAALALCGLPGGRVRPPLADADEQVRAEVVEALEAVGVDHLLGTDARAGGAA